MDVYLEPVFLARLVDDVNTIVDPMVQKNGNTLKIECPADIGALRTDLTKLKQSLIDFLSNAAKFTKDGVVTLRLSRRDIDGKAAVRFDILEATSGWRPSRSAGYSRPSRRRIRRPRAISAAPGSASPLGWIDTHPRPALVLVDLMMPNMDGFAFLDAMRERDGFVDLPIVVLTAKELIDSERNFLVERSLLVLSKSAQPVARLGLALATIAERRVCAQTSARASQ